MNKTQFLDELTLAAINDKTMRLVLLLCVALLLSCSGEKSHCIEGDCENGTGVYKEIYQEKATYYKGEFKDRHFVKGRKEDAYGQWQEGEFKNNLLDGTGKESVPEGYYEGSFQNGLKHGAVKFFRNDGTVFDDEYSEGHLVRVIQVTYSDGNVYQGDLKEGRRDGTGTYTWTKDKITYSGSWKNDLKDGEGKFTYTNGDILEGVWAADTLVAQTAYIAKEQTAPIAKEQSASAEKVYKFSKRRNVFYSGYIDTDVREENLSGTITINEQQGNIILDYDEQGNTTWRYAIKSKKQVKGWMCYYGEVFVEKGWIRKYVLKYNLSKPDDRFHITEYVRDKFNIETDGYDSFHNVQLQMFFSGQMMH